MAHVYGCKWLLRGDRCLRLGAMIYFISCFCPRQQTVLILLLSCPVILRVSRACLVNYICAAYSKHPELINACFQHEYPLLSCAALSDEMWDALSAPRDSRIAYTCIQSFDSKIIDFFTGKQHCIQSRCMPWSFCPSVCLSHSCAVSKWTDCSSKNFFSVEKCQRNVDVSN